MIIEPDFCDHWKTRTLVGLLNDEAAPVYVLRLWAHCQNRKQSTFENFPTEAIKALCRFPGDSNKLEASLTTSGFIRRDSDKLIVVGWDHYNKSLIAAWENGKRGGRPSGAEHVNSHNKTQGITQGITHGVSDGVTDKTRGDERGLDERREENISSRKDRSADRGRSSPSTGKVFQKEEKATRTQAERPTTAKLDLSGVNWSEVGILAELAAKRVPPVSSADRRAWLKYAILATTAFSESWLMDAAEAAATSRDVKRSRQALFVHALQVGAHEKHETSIEDFKAIFASLEIPVNVWKSEVLKTGGRQQRPSREEVS